MWDMVTEMTKCFRKRGVSSVPEPEYIHAPLQKENLFKTLCGILQTRTHQGKLQPDLIMPM